MSDKENRPKFPMHDIHLEKSIRGVRNAIIASLTAGFLFYVLVALPRRTAYRNFYAAYNVNDSFERMRAAGVFSSCPADGDDTDKKKEDENKNKEDEKKAAKNKNK